MNIKNVLDKQQQIYEDMYKDADKMESYLKQIIVDKCVQFIIINKVPKAMENNVICYYVRMIESEFIPEIYGDIVNALYQWRNKL